MLQISVCIIARNEEQHIEECLKRIKPYHYEIVLVDTGSTDKTLEIAAKYTDKIYHFDWINDFSAAKNFAVLKASNDWILSLDCAEGSSAEADISDASQPIPVYAAPITVLHVGYDGSEEEMQAKSRRNIALLEQELKTAGPDAYLYYQLAQSCMKLKDYEKAYEWFNLGLSMDIEPSQDYVQNMVESYGYCLLDMKRFQEALQLENIYEVFAVRADFVFLMGLIYMNNGLFTEAVEEFIKCTSMEQFSVEGINSYRAYYNIGVIYECTGQKDEARKYYRKCGGFEMARKRLRELT